MILDREKIRSVDIDIMPMYIETHTDPTSQMGSGMRKDDKEKFCFLARTDENDIEKDLCYMRSRFGALVDEYGNVLNAVTKGYNLIPNREIIAAFDLQSDEAGLDLKAKSSHYYKGRSMWRMTTPDPFYVSGDSSPHYPMVDIWHDSRGTGGLNVRSGIFREWCTNGCTHEVLHAASNTTNHRKETNLMEFFSGALKKLSEAIVAMQEVHQAAGEVQADLRSDNVIRRAVVQVFRDTAPRYRPRLSRTIRTYSDTVGPTVHALIQSVSDLATHDMQDGVRRHEWAEQSTQHIIDALLQEVAT